jgi:hypothetical protein
MESLSEQRRRDLAAMIPGGRKASAQVPAPMAWRPRLTDGWHTVTPALVAQIAASLPDGGHELTIYEKRLTPPERLLVLVERHPLTAPARRGWHLSISHGVLLPDGSAVPGRDPTWEEIKDARYRFTPPTVEMAMILPRPEHFVNVHATCFHLHQWFEPGEGRVP